MNNENKCFFSISLENGITITGDNANEVKYFLGDLHMCIADAIENEINDKNPDWKNYLIKLRRQINNAWVTINTKE